jgi:hypothetical protein
LKEVGGRNAVSIITVRGKSKQGQREERDQREIQWEMVRRIIRRKYPRVYIAS